MRSLNTCEEHGIQATTYITMKDDLPETSYAARDREDDCSYEADPAVLEEHVAQLQAARENRRIAGRVRGVSALSDPGLRLLMGELSSQEIRSIRAVLNYIQAPTKQ